MTCIRWKVSSIIGGLVPLVRFTHDRHAVEQTWGVEVTWLRTLVRIKVTR